MDLIIYFARVFFWIAQKFKKKKQKLATPFLLVFFRSIAEGVSIVLEDRQIFLTFNLFLRFLQNLIFCPKKKDTSKLAFSPWGEGANLLRFRF